MDSTSNHTTKLANAGRRLIAEDTPEPGTLEWEQQRASGLGGSDIAAAAGLNPYKSPIRLWEEKLGIVPPDDLSNVESVNLGRRLEAAVAEEYAERTGRSVRRVNQTLRLASAPWMMAHLDRKVQGEQRGLEVKTAGLTAPLSREWGEDGSDEIPTVYLCQVQWYLAVTGWEAFDVAALLGGRGLRIYHLERNEELIELLLQAGAYFMRCKETGTPPDIKTTDDARRLYPTARKESTIAADDRILDIDENLRIVDIRLKELGADRERHQAAIMAFMGDHEALVHPTLRDKHGQPQRLRTWKEQLTTRIDVERLRDEKPTMAMDYSTVTTSRVFREVKLP